jgi:hypothetical protein
MRRVALVALLLAVLWAAPPPGVAAVRGRTHVVNNCRGAKVRPRYILFACGDGAFYMRQGTWRKWRRWRAVGHGIFHQNDCRPSCAEGTFHTEPGKIVLKHRIKCPGVHRYVFTRARIWYRGRLVGRHRTSADLICPN